MGYILLSWQYSSSMSVLEDSFSHLELHYLKNEELNLFNKLYTVLHHDRTQNFPTLTLDEIAVSHIVSFSSLVSIYNRSSCTHRW